MFIHSFHVIKKTDCRFLTPCNPLRARSFGRNSTSFQFYDHYDWQHAKVSTQCLPPTGAGSYIIIFAWGKGCQPAWEERYGGFLSQFGDNSNQGYETTPTPKMYNPGGCIPAGQRARANGSHGHRFSITAPLQLVICLNMPCQRCSATS